MSLSSARLRHLVCGSMVAPLLIVLALLAVVPLPAVAQIHRQAADSSIPRGTIALAGVVRDTLGRPLVGAEVRVDRHAPVFTAADGSFRLQGLPFAPVDLQVRRIGFLRNDVRITPDAPGTLVELALTLRPSPVQLAVVLVEGRALSRFLHESDYYRRERLGSGRFFGPEYLERWGGAGLGTLIREVPGVVVDQGRRGAYAYARVGASHCRMNVFVDGIYRPEASALGGTRDRGIPLDEIVRKEDILAVEVYRTAALTPPIFSRAGPDKGTERGSRIPSPHDSRVSRRGEDRDVEPPTTGGASCGAIVVWRKPVRTAQDEVAPTTSVPHASLTDTILHRLLGD